jgi:hypothetical protein
MEFWVNKRCKEVKNSIRIALWSLRRGKGGANSVVSFDTLGKSSPKFEDLGNSEREESGRNGSICHNKAVLPVREEEQFQQEFTSRASNGQTTGNNHRRK